MLDSRRIAVVVPARNEARLIGRTLDGIPTWVDLVVVVDDGSDDGTSDVVTGRGEARVEVVRLPRRAGVGGAIARGYAAAFAAGADVAAVMAGDAQMDPGDLEAVVRPVAEARADYVKGNRFRHPSWRDMPRHRRAAGRALAALTRWASRLPVDDCQCGYTALSRGALARLSLEEIWPSWGYPNDLIILLGRRGLKVVEIPVRPIYADESSAVRPWHALTVAWVILRRVQLEGRR